ncbi:OmpA family protein [Roseivirga echinicomitans]
MDSISTRYDEQNPVVTPDGSRMYFVRAGHPRNEGGVIDLGDIWYSDKTENGWSVAKHGGSTINHTGLNGILGFSADGERIYLLNYKDGEGNVHSGVAVAEWVRDHWSVPQPLNIRYFANNSERLSGTISPDEKVMILSYESFDTFGNEDLYVTFKGSDDTWSQPKNLGVDVNTMGDEWAPFLAADLKTLYFSSNIFVGEGGRDIFVSQRKDNSWTDWTDPVNLGPEINTPGTELGYFIPRNGELAYFSSSHNSKGLGDIFGFPLNETEKMLQEMLAKTESPLAKVTEPKIPEKPVVVMTMQVLDIRNNQPINGIVKLNFGEKEVEVNTTDLDSPAKKFLVTIEQGLEVNVEILAEGYLKYKETFLASATPQNGDSDVKGVEGFKLTPREVGTKIKIENVLFHEGTSSFVHPKIAAAQLEKLIALMKNNPDLEIRLEGHTDNRGNPKLLKALSLDRVDAVKDYLVENGITGKRIETEGFGSEKPIGQNSDFSGRELNRRVEFVIIK